MILLVQNSIVNYTADILIIGIYIVKDPTIDASLIAIMECSYLWIVAILLGSYPLIFFY